MGRAGAGRRRALLTASLSSDLVSGIDSEYASPCFQLLQYAEAMLEVDFREDCCLTSPVNRLGRFVLDGVLQRHDPRLERPTAGQLQLEPLRRRLGRQQGYALAEQHRNHGDLHGIH